MAVIVVYASIVLIGDAIAVVIAAEVERFSHTGSLMVFFTLFTLSIWLGWLLAVLITERSIHAK